VLISEYITKLLFPENKEVVGIWSLTVLALFISLNIKEGLKLKLSRVDI
jgi:hypothetical protein